MGIAITVLVIRILPDEFLLNGKEYLLISLLQQSKEDKKRWDVVLKNEKGEFQICKDVHFKNHVHIGWIYTAKIDANAKAYYPFTSSPIIWRDLHLEIELQKGP